MAGGGHLSKDFFDLVKGIGESKSKQEEDAIVLTEVGVLRRKMAEKGIEPKKMREYLVRMIYVEMLGVEFGHGHIHAVNLAHEKSLMEKRVGYLAVSLCLHAGHELMLLLINTIQQDLRSDNFLEVSMALIVVGRLVNAETLPALLPLVIKALEHAQANVRKKAISCLHRFLAIDPTCLQNLSDKVKKALCDRDPSVMGASLPLLVELCRNDPAPYRDIVQSLVSILKQVTEHRLPRDFDYHRMPAPWIQIKILQVLSHLGASDRQASEAQYDILHEVMKRADIGITIGYAVLCECIRTIATIHPSQSLLEEASGAVARFLGGDNHNLKYLGIHLLALLVRVNPAAAADHQLVVIDCLEDPDETLRRKTLDLLVKITNTQNVPVIIDKLVRYLRGTTDSFLRLELVSRMTQLAERYAPSSSWYIHAMNTILELGGPLVRPEVPHTMMRLIAEGSQAAVDGDQTDPRAYAADAYLQILIQHQLQQQTAAQAAAALAAGDFMSGAVGTGDKDGPKPLPDVLVRVVSWVLGEYAHLSKEGRREVAVRLLTLLQSPTVTDLGTRGWILTALGKLVAQEPSLWSHDVQSLPIGSASISLPEAFQRQQASLSTDLQQRAYEIAELVKQPSTMRAALPLDNFASGIEIDEGLPFLNSYVAEALAAGASPYHSQTSTAAVFDPSAGHSGSGLKFNAYAPAAKAAAASRHQQVAAPPAHQSAAALGMVTPTVSTPTATDLRDSTAAADVSLKFNTKKMWGPDGYNDEVKSTPTPAPAAVPAASPSMNVAQVAAASVAASAHSAAQQAKPAAPAVPSEREKMAAALFSGVGAGSGGLFSSIPRSTATPAAAAAAVAKPAPVASAVDILDMSFGTPAPTVVAAPAASPVPAASKSDDFDLLFSPSPAVHAPAPTVHVPVAHTPAAVAHVTDVLDLLNVSTPAPSASLPAAATQRLAALGVTSHTETVIASDAHVSISLIRAAHAERTVWLLVLRRAAGASTPIRSAALHLPIPAQLTAQCEVQPAGGPAPAPGMLALPPLEGSNAVCVWASFVCALVTRWPQNIVCTLGYVDPQSQQRKTLPATIDFGLSDVLRPAALTTPQFGQTWKALSCEQKFSCTMSDGQQLMSKARANGMHPVETIGAENIIAARLLLGPGAQASPVLIHARSRAGGADVMVRAADAQVAVAIAQLLHRVWTA